MKKIEEGDVLENSLFQVHSFEHGAVIAIHYFYVKGKGTFANYNIQLIEGSKIEIL